MTSLLLLKSMLFASVLQKKNGKKRRPSISKNPEIDLKKMCRICNAEKGKFAIFNNKYFPNIPEEIKHFSGVVINKGDDFSKHICQGCLKLLKGCIRFRHLCQKNNRRMTEMSVKKETINLNEETNSMEHESEESFNIPSPTFSDENVGIWACTSCSKGFNDMTSYNNHLSECNISNEAAKHNEEGNKKTFLCDICGKTARSNANLLVHMAIHENIFPFKCEQCPYQGRTMDLLKVHKRTHLADKPFKCTQCPKSTTTSSNLAKHMRHVHSTTRPYKCTYCDKAFSYQHDMKRHVKDIHLRQGTVECDVCFKKFNTKKILQGHRWKIHKIKGERHGRLPSYLQCRQVEEPREDKVHEYETMIY